MPSQVSRGSTGQDVVTLQSKLNSRPPTSLPQLRVDGIFGVKTDARVREFQVSQQLKPDGIVGRLTWGKLLSSQPVTGNFIHCDAFPRAANPRGPTVFQLGFAVSAGAAAAPAVAASPRTEALARKQDAVNWVTAALAAIQVVSTLMRSGLTANFNKLATMEENRALETHFKLSKHPDPLQFLSFLGKSYSLISIAVANADQLFQEDLTNTKDFAFAFPGGINNRSDPKTGRLFFCPNYVGNGPLFQTAVIVHEAAHFADRTILHFASELPAPNGTPVDSSKNYVQLTPQEAAANAYSYAQFALHCFKRRDQRIVPFNE